MRNRLSLLASLVGLTACQTAPETSQQPLADGPYTFVVRFAERLDRTGGSLHAEIRGRHIRFTSEPGSSVFPTGLVEEGELFWHEPSRQWIVTNAAADTKATAVGGCSGGPTAVDLKERVYWTC